MSLKRNIFHILLLALLAACIKPYDPPVPSSAAAKYVVAGRVTDAEGWQVVEVSLSSPIGDPSFIAVTGCDVKIADDRGNIFNLEDNGNGQYRIWLGSEYLVPGTSYMVIVNTPEGDSIQSTYEKLTLGPPLDSVYYILEDIPTSNPEVNLRGMQFYVDLRAEGYESRYFMWDVVETWEFHTPKAVEYYYDGSFHKVDPPDSSNMICWSSGLVKNIFTISTKSLSQNIFIKYPLHFVDGHTSRLGILYTILVTQLTLSEAAFNYWEQLRVLVNEQGGLYEKQPLPVIGNLSNITHPEKEVLGYFFAASASSIRLYYKEVEGLELDFFDYCGEEILGQGGWKKFHYYDYPIYYYYNPIVGLRLIDAECVDCRLLGGTTIKPEFWPQL
jgi:hypothetical protein